MRWEYLSRSHLEAEICDAEALMTAGERLPIVSRRLQGFSLGPLHSSV
jgi:hypothetical protein